jgi:hypothetical protein
MHTKFWSGKLKVRVHMEDLNIDKRIILDWILEKEGGEAWTGLVWLRIRTSGGFL